MVVDRLGGVPDSTTLERAETAFFISGKRVNIKLKLLHRMFNYIYLYLLFISVTRRVKEYTGIAGKYVTGRRKRFRPYILIRITSRVDIAMSACQYYMQILWLSAHRTVPLPL